MAFSFSKSAGVYHEPRAAGQFAAGMPKVNLSQVELHNAASPESFASGTGARTPAPTRKDSSTSEAPASLPQDGWGQGFSPVPKELFASPEQHPPNTSGTHVEALQEFGNDKATPPGNDGLEGQQRDETGKTPEHEKIPVVPKDTEAEETQVVPEPPPAQEEPKETKTPEPTPESKRQVPEPPKGPKVAHPKADAKGNLPAEPQPKSALYQKGNYWRTACLFYLIVALLCCCL